MTTVATIIAAVGGGGTSWATPAWSVVTLLLGALLAAVTSLILYLLRRADASAKRADEAEQDAVIESDHEAFKLLYERRLARVEGHVFGPRAGELDPRPGGGR